MDPLLHSKLEEWLRYDKNPITRAEIEALRDAGNTEELGKRLLKRIEFGTAGLRGRMAAGFACMNDVIVIQASQGLCAYVLQNVPNASSRGVVVGHDHRYNSERWAQLTAAAFVSQGVKVYLHKGIVHTPLVPYTVSKLSAAAGVMITASHNPKDDNGYKVYWENAVQIIAPHDVGIAAAIEANLTPISWDLDSLAKANELVIDRTEEMKVAYLEYIASLSRTRSTNASVPLKFTNTSMHGVSQVIIDRANVVFNFKPLEHVKEQQKPDPDFPTVVFPNPEEKGALDLAIKTANASGSSYVFAQDPDSDRFAAAQKKSDGTWFVFSGDQLGSLFAAWTLEGYKASSRPIEKLAMVASTVSSKLIGAMAAKEGFKFVESLTGFKYIGNAARTLEAEGYNVLFGYEEAIGFMLGEEVRDKDGVSATMCFAELVSSLHRRGKSATDYLEEIYAKYGYFQTSNSYFICSQPEIIDQIFARLRSYNNSASLSANKMSKYPLSIGGLKITGVRDLTSGYGFDNSADPPNYTPLLPVSGGHMITFKASSDGVAIVLTIRTSGTEPKIKYYLEGSGTTREQVSQVLARVVDELGGKWMEAKLHNLGSPSP
ncbi:Phosphoglucomutase/phosphomannomutase, alpha/beta/alpha domain containing protein [Ceratobasidium theobromae]|uniref:Phosphoglucomutase/phosphomannomutase, alpha/beta/alpha domain containing protein n=1 Tax=Ceratobasidium theobromae TaxID=1582974 RepID=A0A5N5QMF3_9AGAM|nr:Phosphoglucomutase/phosphomannomutase, alpha/beta/alpha domain containing protein [Ceratobasidium theobromae]